MKPSTELFQLVKSLSKSEKRYFKLSSSLQSGEKNYMKLFDAIEYQLEYDENALKEKFSGETFINHLPSEKNHLYNLILKSLRGFYSDKSAGAILQEQIRNIELLVDRALYKECSKIIRKAKKMAYDYEKYYFLLDLIDWEKTLVEEEYLRGDFDKDLTKLVEEESECLEKLRNLAEYQILYSKINYVFRTGGYIRTGEEQVIVDEIANYHLIKGKNTALSTKAATACYFIKGLCATTERNLDDTHTNFSKVVKIMEENPMIMRELPKRYVKALNNVMFSYMDYGDWKNCNAMIEKLKGLAKLKGFESADVQLKLFTYPHNAELLVNIARGNFQKAITDVVPAIINGLEEYDIKINNEEVMLFYYNISRVYFGAGDYKAALKYINLVLNNSETGLREDVYTFARLVNLVIHYELGNYDLLDYTIKSAKRFVAKSQKNYKFENVFLKDFKKLLKNKDTETMQELFKDFKNELTEVLKDPYEQAANEYFDFISWLDARIENKTFAEVVRSKLA
jgi:dGTP triphosphohydrolase